jgi:hypothetical protein
MVLCRAFIALHEKSWGRDKMRERTWSRELAEWVGIRYGAERKDFFSAEQFLEFFAQYCVLYHTCIILHRTSNAPEITATGQG